MNRERARTVYPRFWKGVKKNHRGGFKRPRVLGYDSETYYGSVYASGYSVDGVFDYYYDVKGNHANAFIKWVLENMDGKRPSVCAAHYLSFDLSVLFFDILGGRNNSVWFSHVDTRAELELHFTRPCFGKIRLGKKTCHLIDTFSFLTCSLENALKDFGGKIQKQKKPDNLGKVIVPERDLIPYLKSDTLGVDFLMNKILDWHEENDILLCISAPMLAGKIFRHKFIKNDFIIPNVFIREGALLSYHGGKNGFYGAAGYYEKCYELDITSAYPDAMLALPNFEGGYYEKVKGFQSVWGVYKITGHVRPCKYPIIFNHDFKAVFGDIKDIWITGFELKEALKRKEFKPDSIEGWVFCEAKNQGLNPFNEYIHYFFKEKENAKKTGEKSKEIFYKLMLNSLYGKFVQRVKDEETGDYVAGGMFDPFIATLITGHCNARIHGLEHDYRSIHTATDSVKTLIPPRKKDLTGKIGGLKKEIFGTCLILRNKLYYHFGADGKNKVGLHGFQGSPEDLLRLYKQGKTEGVIKYQKKRLLKWKEAGRRGLIAGQEELRDMTLKYT